VSAAAASRFTVSAPASATAGTAITFTVTAFDAFNNMAVGYSGTVHFTSSDAAAVLPANAALTAGTGSFQATLKTAGSQTLTATDSVLSSVTGTSAAITVTGSTPPIINNFVQQEYVDLLHRPADPGGLQYWTTQLETGALTRFQEALAFENSLEYRTDEVEADYEQFLGRPADPMGLASFVAALAAGATPQQVQAAILGSQEFFQGPGGSTIPGFVNALCEDVFGRPAGPADIAAANQLISLGDSRADIALVSLFSQEAITRRVDSYYVNFLDRQPDAPGLAAWVNAELTGTPDLDVIAYFISSPEYLARLGGQI
jgi:hypothetical protein